MTMLGITGDDSTKHIPADSITPPWLPAFNALSRGFVEHSFRPVSWDMYFSNVRTMRENSVTAIRDLRAAIVNLSQIGPQALSDTTSWDNCKRSANADFFLPVTAVDEWGFVTESRVARVARQSHARKFTAISTLEPFNKALNDYTSAIGSFIRHAIQALILLSMLRKTTTNKARQIVFDTARELDVNEDAVRLSVVFGVDACCALRELHRTEALIIQDDRDSWVDESIHRMEVDEYVDTMRAWIEFCYPEQVLDKPKRTTTARARKRREPFAWRDTLVATEHRIAQELRGLRSSGIVARIATDTIPWNDDSALWITYDTQHPLGAISAITVLWSRLVAAFRPDLDKIARIKSMDWFWKRIILVPLVKGRSLERLAFAYMRGVTYPGAEPLESQLWRLVPEPIPETAWNALGCAQWERQSSWDAFDRFAASYGALFHHIDHVADFGRCSVDIDDIGTTILQDYLRIEQKRADPFLQETFDSCAQVLFEFPELDESVAVKRPNILRCMNCVIEMRSAILPTEDFNKEITMTLNQITEWRDRLKFGMGLLGEARSLWIADSLGFEGFELPV